MGMDRHCSVTEPSIVVGTGMVGWARHSAKEGKVRKPKRPSGSMVVAITALFIALGGVASANAGFFDGHEIKPGTVGHQQLASHSVRHANLGAGAVHADNVPASLLKQLKRGPTPSSDSTGAAGSQGPKSETGPQGPPGPKGDTGATGATVAQGPQGSLSNYEVNNGTDWMLGTMPLALPDWPCSCYENAGVVVDLGDLNDTDFRAITYTGTVYRRGHLADNIWIADGSEAVTPACTSCQIPSTSPTARTTVTAPST